jgi:methionyl-tRNA formyltransferase
MKDKLNIFFFGSHNFAKTILQGLLDSKRFNICLVVTQPDRPVGREKKLQSTPVKLLAEKYSIKIAQPESLKNFDLNFSNIDASIVAQYGLLIPKKIIDSPKFGTINVHTSLLPKYRGASPIQTAILNGDKKTGLTIMKMDEGLDTGPIIAQKEIKIMSTSTYEQLEAQMAEQAVPVLIDSVFKYANNEIQPAKQDEKQKSECRQISKEDGRIDWNKNSDEIYNKFRAFSKWPGIWTMWAGKRIKLLNIAISSDKIEPGKVILKDDIMHIGCNNGSIIVKELVLEGKQPSEACKFLNGYKNFTKVE